LLVAERKGGKISLRDAQLAFTSKFRPSAQMTRSWFGELVALGYGVVQKSGTGKSLIFEITSRLQEQSLQQPSNSIPANISASTTTDPTTISCLQAHSPTVGVVDEMIHVRLQAEPIQEEGLRSVVGDDPVDDHLSEKTENQNVSDCLKFIRAAISDNDPQAMNCKTAPKLKIKFGSRFANKFLLVSFLIWVVQVVTRQSQLFQLRSVFRQRFKKLLIGQAEEPPPFTLRLLRYPESVSEQSIQPA
jgi:hypothetical protein